MKNLHSLKSSHGFSLIELVIVIAIIAILAAVAIPRLGGFSNTAKESADKKSADIVANAAKLYYMADSTRTDADLTVPNLDTAQLLDDRDVLLHSAKYGGTSTGVVISADQITLLSNGTVTVTIGTSPNDYTVTK